MLRHICVLLLLIGLYHQVSADRSGFLLGADYYSSNYDFEMGGNSFGARMGVGFGNWLVMEAQALFTDADGFQYLDNTLNGLDNHAIRELAGYATLRFHPFGAWLYFRGGGGWSLYNYSANHIVYQNTVVKGFIEASGPAYIYGGGIELHFIFVGIGFEWITTGMSETNKQYKLQNERVSETDTKINIPPMLKRSFGATLTIYF